MVCWQLIITYNWGGTVMNSKIQSLVSETDEEMAKIVFCFFALLMITLCNGGFNQLSWVPLNLFGCLVASQLMVAIVNYMAIFCQEFSQMILTYVHYVRISLR
jgi:hypothetical protein